jgi:hypothetical protein
MKIQDFQEYLHETLLADLELNDTITGVHTFEEDGIHTEDSGLVVYTQDGSVFTVAINKDR